MKIIHIMDSLGVAGGVNSFVYDLCLALKDDGQDVTLVGIIGDSEESKNQAMSVREEGIPVYCMCMSSKKQALAVGIPKLRKLIKSIAQDEETVCNLHLKLSVLMGGLATVGLRNVKCVETYHSNYSHYALEYTLMKRRISKYIPCSVSAGKEMQERFRVPDKKIVVIPNGVNRACLRKIAGESEKENGIHVLSVGRLTAQKNYPVAIKAFKTLCGETMVYQIIGDGEDKDSLIKLAEGNPYIQFMGNMSRTEVLQRTKRADIIVMSSLWEGLSIYLLEAMALGKALILSNISSFTDTMNEVPLKEGEGWRVCRWGYLVDTRDSTCIVAAMQHFLHHEEMKNEFENYVKDYAENFNIAQICRDYGMVYDEVAGNSCTRRKNTKK